ncbi:NADPH-dependent FMN reductase [Microvirga rosea]|uniref:NADPH-dependent FMN reductase n=1 Tax=Microvirga rosea TaxID=2715425 RepID=UPI001D0B8BAF|nr:NAD(P)H-dependent oxidoreductase [Microvirga rosea]MCB8822771.1 NAD(P)H-dependent oxidoreductase [Microvirga rosea]
MSLKLNTIICSTRPGRVGPAVARWFHEEVGKHGQFQSTLIDLAELNLPLYDEPEHPILRRYRHDHTKAWSASVAAADAYVFVTPEYNFNPPPAFFNALNYVYAEWNYKPAGLVSYGGVSGGLRAAQIAKQILTTVKVMPMTEGVPIPSVAQLLDADKKNFQPNDLVKASVKPMLDELHRWAQALKSMRS